MPKKDREHFNLLCNIGELAALLTGSDDIQGFLQLTAIMVARHLDANVCSIYLYEEGTNSLVLKATVGLNPAAVGSLRLKPAEGLVGKTFEAMTPVCEAEVSKNPDFKFIENVDEERLESFLAVPILRGVQRIGVLVVQHEKPDYFKTIDIMALRASASQLAGAIENARMLINIHRKPDNASGGYNSTNIGFIKAKPASKGFAFAPASIFNRSHVSIHMHDIQVEDQYDAEDFHRAVQKTIEQLKELQDRLSERLPESASLIFTAHFMILKDPQFIKKIVNLIEKGVSPPKALKTVAKEYIDILSSSSHAYIREKANDIEDLSGRILKNLLNLSSSKPGENKGKIVIVQDLFPSEILKLASENVEGVIMIGGGITSHVSILSRSLKIPMVLTEKVELLGIMEGTPILIDGDIGNIYIRPSDEIIEQFNKQKQSLKKTRSLSKSQSPETYTQDGHRVYLFANINILSEINNAVELKAEGVGLYRTEFPFLIRPTFPSEEEQFMIYKKLFEGMPDKEVTIRTLDVGGDKVLAYSDTYSESNPALGLRSIRFSLRYKDVFVQQIRAILRASANRDNVRIMFPMISSLDEFLHARQLVLDCQFLLEHEGLSHNRNPAIGMMVELPSVIEIIDAFSQEVDFFSIGTNDFVQYMLAVDRGNVKVSDYYRPYHPSVLRGLAKIVKSAIRFDKDISICGEMAHESEYIPFLLGIGVRKFSADPQYLPALQERINSLSLPDAKEYARELLAETTLKSIHELLHRQTASNNLIRDYSGIG